jgi:hypothetical protein
MNIVPRIGVVLAAEPNEAQLDKYLSDLRDSLAGSSKQFIAFSLLVITALVTYHLVVYEGATGLALNTVQLADARLFRKVFLVVPSAMLAAAACIGYLRRCQREVYDYLTISRYRVLGTTGLHELRLPADYILGLFLLRTEGGAIGKAVSTVVVLLSVAVFDVGPAVYIVQATAENVVLFGFRDFLTIVAGGIAFLLSASSLVVIVLAARVKAT